MNDNLDKMSLKDLRNLRNKVERAIESFEDRRKREALAAAEEAAREHGFNLAELTAAKARRSAKVSAKYANPDDPEMTWSGRGRRPRWIQDKLEQGKSLEDMAI